MLFSRRGALHILCLLLSSAYDICDQFGPRTGPTKCRACSGSKLFDTWMLLLKEVFEYVDFEKYQQSTKNKQNYPACNI